MADHNRQKQGLLQAEDDYQQYPDHGGEILKSIGKRYLAASPVGKKQIIGSIIEERLIFSKNDYRTNKPNEIIDPITRTGKGSSGPEKGKAGENSDLSGSGPTTGSFANQFLLILKRLSGLGY